MDRPKELNTLSSQVLKSFFALEDFFRARGGGLDTNAFKDMLHNCVDKFVETSREKKESFRACLEKSKS